MTEQKRYNSARAIPPTTAAPKAAKGGGKKASGFLVTILPVFLLPAFVVKLVSGQAVAALVLLAGIILLATAGLLIRGALRFEYDYHQRRITPGAKFPNKLLAYALIGAAVFVSALFASPYGLGTALLVGVLAMIAGLFAYGLDAMKAKTIDEVQAEAAGLSSKRLLGMITEAEQRLKAMEATAAQLQNRDLAGQLTRIVAKARTVISLVEQDPKDLNQSRRFFVTYLDQVQQVSQGYAKHEANIDAHRTHDQVAANYKRVMDTIEQAFDEQATRLRANDLMSLDVQIEVLQTQLDREGLA